MTGGRKVTNLDSSGRALTARATCSLAKWCRWRSRQVPVMNIITSRGSGRVRAPPSLRGPVRAASDRPYPSRKRQRLSQYKTPPADWILAFTHRGIAANGPLPVNSQEAPVTIGDRTPHHPAARLPDVRQGGGASWRRS